MKTINIQGKEYVTVAERIKEAHAQDKDVSITAEIVENADARISIKATVVFKGKTFTGHSQAEYGKGRMGGVALEVAETSAIGRALGFANIGLVDSVASVDEMKKAGAKIAPAQKHKSVSEAIDSDDVPF